MNDRQKVASVSLLVALTLFGGFWLAAQFSPRLAEDDAFLAAVLVIIPISVLAPLLRGIRR